MSVSDLLLQAAFRFGPRIPERALRAGAALAADVTWLARTRGVHQLEKNLARIRPEAAHAVRQGSRRALRHYFRYYAEALHLPALSADQISARVAVKVPTRLRCDVQHGSIVVVLGHLGNWDLAGAWAGGGGLAPVLTVAERLKPEEVFQAFCRMRAAVGMEIVPLEKGVSVFPELVRGARRRTCAVALLADRDLTRGGVPAKICGLDARVAAGPAALSMTSKIPLYFAGVRHIRLSGERRRRAGSSWGIEITFFGPYTTPARGRAAVADLTEQWTAQFSTYLRAHPLHWHMLQPVFDEDLDVDKVNAKQSAHREV